jgi:hypothetical protein
MTMWKPILLSVLIASSTVMIATPGTAAGADKIVVAAGGGMSALGTPKEQAACRPDIRRFCSKVKQGSDSSAFLSCLKANRTNLSKACLAVLLTHGA